MRRTTALLAGLLLLAAALPAAADVLTTTDGKIYQGELVKKEGGKVHFRIIKYGAKMVKIFEAHEVASIEEKPLPGAEADPPDEAAEDGDTDAADGDADDARHKAIEKAREAARQRARRRHQQRRWDLPIGHLPPEPEAPPVVEHDGPTYYVIPLTGEVGRTVCARVLEASLADAAKRKPTAVVLAVDSPGGSVQEMSKICELLRSYKDKLRIVVLVKKALSAAAILSLNAEEIYVRPAGIIGAATAYKRTVFGLPEVLEEKMMSVVRATARAAAETGKHQSILAEAMIDPDIILHYAEDEQGNPVAAEGGGDKMLVRAGRLLTVTGREAARCGLAAGHSVEDLADLGARLDQKGWTECKGLGQPLATYWSKVIDKFEKDLQKYQDAYVDAIRDAEASDPKRGQYWVKPDGSFTKESLRQWYKRSEACAKHLKRAYRILEDAAKMAGKLEEYQDLVELLERVKTDVKNRAERIHEHRKDPNAA